MQPSLRLIPATGRRLPGPVALALAAFALVGTAAAAPDRPALAEGRFGRALDARAGGLTEPADVAWRTPPLTIECWVRLASRSAFNIVAACEPKDSPAHWELYTYAGSGHLSLYLPGRGGEFRSTVDVCDDRWHHVAAHLGTDTVRLFVDGRQVLEEPAPLPQAAPGRSRFAIGRLVEGTLGCDGLIDDVRLSRGLRPITAAPDKPLEEDDFTLRLWSLDDPEPPSVPTANEGSAAPRIGTFTPRLGPRPDESDPLALHPFNADRLDDFYAQQAEHFMDRPADALPEVLSPFPGIDGGAFGHWGRRNDDDWRDDAWNAMDVGPVFAGVLHGLASPVPKAVCASLGETGGITICFDPETGGIAGAWTDGFVRFDDSRFGLLGGIRPGGPLVFDARDAAGWSVGSNEEAAPAAAPLVPEFTGTHRSGRRAVFAYRLGEVGVLDAPWARGSSDDGAGGPILTRVLEFDAPLTADLRLFPVTGAIHRPHEETTAVTVPGAFGEAAVRWHVEGSVEPAVDASGTLVLRLRNARRLAFDVSFHADPAGAAARVRPDSGPLPPEAAPSRWIGGGDPLWPEPLVTAGALGAGTGAYVVDTLTVPYDNPWNALFLLAGHDFFSDGTTAAACTIDGDVWTVSGIDADLERLEWRRFATGLHQPLGLLVVDDRVHVLGRDQITILHDRNGDGEADFYENFTNRYRTSPGGHDYITGLERDASGAFYFASANQGVCRVSPDGSRIEVVATGIRNPNGLGVSADGTIAVSPQEGDWTPASMVCLARPGGHFGHRGPRDGRVDPPVCFIPRGVDHATGGHVFADSDRWGPLGGHLITFSWGNCRALLTLMESVDGVAQGTVVPLAGEFLSGAHRGRIHPGDGQLYVTGSTGWGTYATTNGCFQRMRFTERPARLPVAVQAHRNGILLRFSDPLAADGSADAERWFLQRWNYDYSRSYGSPELSVAFPDVPGHDPIDVTRAVVLDDDRSVFLEVPAMAPVDQLHVHGRLRSADGTEFTTDLFATIHRLGPVFTEFEGFAPDPAFAEAPDDLRRAGRAGESAAAHAATGAPPPPAASLPKRPTEPLADGPGRPVHIRCISGLRYDTTEFTVTAGEPLALTLENTDVIPHNLVLVTPGARTAVGERSARMLTEPRALERQYVPDMEEVLVHTLVIDPGQSDTLHFHAPEAPGDYPFLCTFPGHWLIMHGIMRVVAKEH